MLVGAGETARANPNANAYQLLGGGLGRSAYGSVDNKLDERAYKSRREQEALRDYGIAQKMDEDQITADYKQAQTQNTLDKPKLAREQMIARAKADTAKIQARLDVVKLGQDFKSGEAKVYTDQYGKQWKQYLKPDSSGKVREMEPITNPTTGEQEFAPGKQMVDWEDPKTGNIIQVRAEQTLMPGVTLEVGNRNNATEVDKYNSDKSFQANKENINNQMQYQTQIATVLSTMLANDANLTALGSSVTGLRSQMDAKVAEANDLLANIQLDEANAAALTDKKQIDELNQAREKKQARYNSLADSFNTLNGQLYEELGKTDAGKQKADQLKKLMPKAPGKLSFTPIQAREVSGGVGKTGKYSGQSYKLSDIRSAFSGKTDAEIKQIIENNGGTLTN